MSNLRNKLIRLAHSNPELRNDLLPLLTEKKGYEERHLVKISKNIANMFADQLQKDLGVSVNAQYNDQIGENEYEFLIQVDLFGDYDFTGFTAKGYTVEGFKVTKERIALNRASKRIIKKTIAKYSDISNVNYYQTLKVKTFTGQFGDKQTYYAGDYLSFFVTVEPPQGK